MIRRRLPAGGDDGGVYAILYAVLVVVLLGMGSVVVDLASVREDRRLNRSATDAAALAGVERLDSSTTAGAQPYEACLQAWRYLESTLQITKPSGACTPFAGINAKTYCTVASPPLISDTKDVGTRTVSIAWPIPASADQGWLTPTLAPGSISQPANTSTTPGTLNTDGYANGCDKLGVAVFQNQGFGLGGVLGYNGTTTEVHSVARVVPQMGVPDDAAALNVLNPTECQSLVTTGNGKVTVGPVLDLAGNAVSPGIIAVESSGTGTCNGNERAIDPTTGQGSKICASRTAIGAGLCDGQGVILSHALDAGGDSSRSYSTAAVPTNLAPAPISEGGIHGWVPVTRRYGCNALSNCSAPPTNYVKELVNAYGGSGKPTSLYTGSQFPYTYPYPSAFVDRSSVLCPGGSGITGIVIVPAGNNYASCAIDISGSGVVIVQGGTLVLDKGIKIASGGCFVMNTAVTTCPSIVFGSGATVTSPIAPTSDAIMYVRGSSCPNTGCFDNAGTLVIPQTFVYSGGSAPLLQSSTGLTLWTAPGAGSRDGNQRTTLENACYDPAGGSVVEECLNSRFARMTYWSEYAAPKTKPNNFAGQGQLSVVGVFFTPRAYFNFTGGGGYTGAAAQFWADKINVNGGANVGLSPFEKFSIESLRADLVLIR